jgi:hypothetical protein
MLGAVMKYVVFDGYDGEQIIIFPKKIQHSMFASSITKHSHGTMRPISGGFVIDGQCVGESESLRMKSRGDEDTHLIAKLLNLSITAEDGVLTKALVSPKLTKNQAKRLRKKGSKYRV